MGDVGNEFALIVSRHVQFIGHIVQRPGQISQFILFFQRDVVFQISRSKGIRPLYDFSEGAVNHERKYRNNSHHNEKKQEKQNVNHVHQSVMLFLQDTHGKVHGYIALHRHVSGDRHHDA